EPIAEDQARPIMKQIASALQHAHNKGIIHQDLKPLNVFLQLDGQVKLLDFGLARFAVEPSEATEEGEHHERPERFVGGTLAYLAPEQWRGQLPTQRSDLWAAGVTFFEALTGRIPFIPSNGYSRGPAAAPSVRELNPTISAELAAVVARLLEKE